ncbi:MAG: DUF3592 domain-containing protein [Anaerolineae bacterium]|nr:DUF3592 domain-containing protein [Anaerolineae bacterium]
MGFVIIFGAAIFLLGIAYITLGLRWRAQTVISRKWATIPGHILASYVSKKDYPPAPEEVEKSTTVYYEPAVEYSYEVEETPYKGNRFNLFFFPRNYGREKSEKVVAHYPEGSEVTVHYNPDFPKQSVIDTKAPPIKRYPMIIVGIWFAVLGALTAALGIVL